ncbi:uncharacterized protein LOC109842400 [Asparagus officinalis]|uniref:uncharacterized protein LOC109842400 n=1 Tax=Asparagus officinalis TaxID=4686 RepID=UPI00098E1E73|nr:uncharacterized protein LOC109842400 [Asparagus officinalis]
MTPENKDFVTFSGEEWNEGNSNLQFSLIGQVLGLNLKFKVMETYVQKVWTHWSVPKVCLLKPGLFLFKFKSKEEMEDILVNGLWFFVSRPLLLKVWSNDEDIEKINDNVYPLRIQLPGLILNLWSSNAISKIASQVGRPIATDKLTANKQKLAYARVLVEVHMPSPLPDIIPIHGPNGKNFNQKEIYELKPKWCNSCKLVGGMIQFSVRDTP